MPINILMPALSPTMEKGNLAKWLKKEGDKVKSGDVIAEIETDKATMEVEAVDEGTIAKILVPEGTQDVPVNDIIAVLAGDGEDVKAAGAGAARAEGRRSPPRSQPLHRRPHQRRSGAARSGCGTCAAGGRAPRKPTATPASSRHRWRGVWPRKPASNSARINGSGPHGRIVARDVEDAKSGKGLKAPAAAPAAGRPSRRRRPHAAQDQRPRPHLLVAARPPSRQGSRHRLARINGSGPHGRVVARDVEGAKSGKGLKAPAAAPGAAPAHRAVDVGQADPRAVRGGLLRDRAA